MTKPPATIKLNANENPYGVGSSIFEAIAQTHSAASRYPDELPLRQAIADFHLIDVANVTLGNGSSEVLEIIARTFLSHQSEAISSQYAFKLYEEVTRRAGARNSIIPAVQFGHDLPAMISAITARTKIVWIANPNNPTGTFVPPNKLLLQLQKIPRHIIIVLDEAYAEYLEPTDRTDIAKLLTALPNIIIVRTFSKAYGLAGLRVGYGIAHKELSLRLNALKPRFNVNTFGLIAAEAALKDQALVENNCRANAMERIRLENGLRDLNIPYLPGQGNFIVCDVQNATTFSKNLRKVGVAVLPLTAYGMPHHIRVTVGNASENAHFLYVLAQDLGHLA